MATAAPPTRAAPSAPAAAPARLDRRAMVALSTGHAVTDLCQGAVPALLPFLVRERGYSYAAVSALVLAATVASSVVQPLFGLLADRRRLSGLLPAGVGLAGLGIALAGAAPSYGLTFAAVVLSGLGVAAFHPEGSRFASYVSGPRRATGMSLFSVGGNAGFALGTALATPLFVLFGPTGSLALGVPPAAMALLLLRERRRLESFRPAAPAVGAAAAPPRADAARDDWAAFVRLGGAVTARSVAYFGLVTFVPLYFVAELHTSEARGNAALTVMLACGAVGTLLGGRLADRVGRRPVLLGSLTLIAPLVLALGTAGPATATVLLGLVGAIGIATFSVTVVMGQEYLPNRVGLASGVTLGLAIGVGGAGAGALGLVADAHGVRAVIPILAALPLVGAVLAATLPSAPRGADGPSPPG